uniref:WW domain-containing protein n=1 Tax=Alexandrium catenella TaxID=2925 RepID=A0A7S1LXJ8_ALECA|mmetsp:Transcript_15879/g.43187  ORF Transcript_15879/g.43187 Transcript_15879/m.43187 type:complete len:157 (+) Transcript_15879:84-554(+)
MSTLPPNWKSYFTAEGKEYFHNAITNVTQWDRPASELPAFDSGMSDVFQYKPSASELEAAGQQRSGNAPLEMQTSVTVPLGTTPLGKSGNSYGAKEANLSADNEMVSLMQQQVPSGQISASAAVAPAAGSPGSAGSDKSGGGGGGKRKSGGGKRKK